MTATATLPDRDIRQRDIIPPEKLANCHAMVIGVGAIGRQVAIQLASIGMPAIDLVDHDQVGVENLAPQGYWPRDIGGGKVAATWNILNMINPGIKVNVFEDKFKRSSPKSMATFTEPAPGRKLLVFCCVDNMEGRKIVYETTKSYFSLFVDARMSAEVMRVLTVDTLGDLVYYSTTLFSQAEAFVGGCTAKSTIYTASIAAGFMVSSFTKWLRGLPVERDVTLNMLAAELTVQ